jgi:hypothetical protein
MKYTTDMVSGAMTYIPNFIKTGSGIQKLKGVGRRIHRDIGRMEIA